MEHSPTSCSFLLEHTRTLQVAEVLGKGEP